MRGMPRRVEARAAAGAGYDMVKSWVRGMGCVMLARAQKTGRALRLDVAA